MDRQLLASQSWITSIPNNIHGVSGGRADVRSSQQERPARTTQDGRQFSPHESSVRNFLPQATQLRPQRFRGKKERLRERRRRGPGVEQ